MLRGYAVLEERAEHLLARTRYTNRFMVTFEKFWTHEGLCLLPGSYFPENLRNHVTSKKRNSVT